MPPAKSNKAKEKPGSPGRGGRSGNSLFNHFPLVALLGVLVVVLGILFWKSFLPGMVLFSNDASLGFISATAAQPPGCFAGIWWDLNWLGSEYVTPSLSLSALIREVCGITGFAKFYCPLALLIAGLGAGFCSWKLKLAPAACVLGGLAAALNMDFFSDAAWGVAAQVIGFGACYVALGCLADTTPHRRWVRLILGGLAVGFGVVEAFDIGAIFSLYLAAFVIYHALFLSEDGKGIFSRFGWGGLRLAVVAVFAAFIAAHALSSLVGTQIVGVTGTKQDQETKRAMWPTMTQWSVPKAEGLQIMVPGLFGFRMDWPLYDADQPGNDRYWGAVGQDPNIPMAQAALNDPDPNRRNAAQNYLNTTSMWRFQGNGIYAGAVVVFIGLWAVTQALRRKGSPFTQMQRRAIWFWSAAALISLLLGFGKYAPFYQIFYYWVPYAHTIRNPIKFMHVLNWILVILFAYGVHGLFVTYLQNPVNRVNGLLDQFKHWRVRAPAFDRNWMTGCFCALGASALVWLLYAMQNNALAAHLQTIHISAADAPGIAKFSLRAAGWFVWLLALTSVWLALVFSGQFSGPRAKWGVFWLGALVFVDLGLADWSWIVHWDTNYKYTSDSLVEFLAQKPYEHRVGVMPQEFGVPETAQAQQQLGILHYANYGQLKQNLYLYRNIQCYDVVQESRVGTDKTAFLQAIPWFPQDPRPQDPRFLFRLWQLSNTRYILGQGGRLPELINQQFRLGTNGFRIVQSFDFIPKRGEPSPYPVDYNAVFNTNGSLAVIEYLGALPRASLYSNWQVNTNDDETLKTLARPEFDAHQSVLVADAIAPPPASNSNQVAGTVEIKPDYQPKRVELEADVKTPAVLLLCDRFHPGWKVTVDGKAEKVLRCNYIERGVQLQPGKHTVVFEFSRPVTTLWVNAAADLLGVALCGWLVVDLRRWLRGVRGKPAGAKV
jgi:hypothetical protein